MEQPLDRPPTEVSIECLLRELTPQVLGAVVRRFRDFAAAEDAVQEASLQAAVQWPREGLPNNPRAWLTQVFRRMATRLANRTERISRGLRADKWKQTSQYWERGRPRPL